MEEEIVVEEQEKGFNKKVLITYIVSAGIVLTIGVIFGLMLYFFSYKDTEKTALQYWADVVSATGALGVLVWLFALMTSYGAFDMIAYGTRKMFNAIFRRNPRTGLPRTYTEYVESKREKEHNNYWPFLFISLGILVVGIILLIIHYSIQERRRINV